jgi:hypothetical protein
MKLNLKPRTLLMFGLICLVLANISHFILTRDLGFTGNGSDFVFGALMGLFIGAVILSLILRRKSNA